MKKTHLLVVSALRQNARMKLTEMTRQVRVPVSSIFDMLRSFESRGIIRKYSAIVRFGYFGFNAHALLLLSVVKKDRERLLDYLGRSQNVNSIYQVNNGWDFMVEVVFPGVREVEDFLVDMDGVLNLKERKVLYIVDELKKECFLSSPELMRLNGGEGL